MTNGDIIRQMNNIELAKVIGNYACEYCIYKGQCDKCLCYEGVLAWLEEDSNGQH